MVSWSRSELQIVAISSSKGAEEPCHLLSSGDSSCLWFAGNWVSVLFRYLLLISTRCHFQRTDIYRDLHMLSTYWTW
jgi:hypothetical protein